MTAPGVLAESVLVADAVVSLTLQGAADAVGVSVDVIRRAVRAGDLVAVYPRVGGRTVSRPVIRLEDLRAWVATFTTERPGRVAV